MNNPSVGFLEQLYFGSEGRAELSLKSAGKPDLEKIAVFLKRYEETLKPFKSAELEALGTCPPALMQGLKELGIFGLIIPKEYGGLGFTIPEYLLTVEGMSRVDMSLVLIPLAHLSIGLKGILLFGNEFQKRKYLVPAASGQTIFAYALTEPHIGSDAQHVETSATPSPDGKGWILNGTKTYITNANYAGAFTAFAQLDPEKPGFMGAFVVDRAAPGVDVGADMVKMGLKVSSTAMVRFKDVFVPNENLLGVPGDGFKIAMSILNYGRLGLGAASSGLMRQSIRDMSDRAKSRIQFGKPIAEFELIQEKIVKAAAHAFASEAITSWAADMLEDDPLANVAIESSHAKLYGTTRCWDVLYDALQTAGGSGYLSTHPYEKRMRDFRVTTIFEGTSEIHTMYPAANTLRAIDKVVKEARKAKGTGAAAAAWLKLSGRKIVLKSLNVFWHSLAEYTASYKPEGKVAFGTTSIDRSGPVSKAIPPTLIEAEIRAAAKIMTGLESTLRAHIRYGVGAFGKNVAEHEFVLRRITESSLYLYILLAGARRMCMNLAAVSELDLASYVYLCHEAKLALADLKRTGEGSTAFVHRRLWGALGVKQTARGEASAK